MSSSHYPVVTPITAPASLGGCKQKRRVPRARTTWVGYLPRPSAPRQQRALHSVDLLVDLHSRGQAESLCHCRCVCVSRHSPRFQKSTLVHEAAGPGRVGKWRRGVTTAAAVAAAPRPRLPEAASWDVAPAATRRIEQNHLLLQQKHEWMRRLLARFQLFPTLREQQ